MQINLTKDSLAQQVFCETVGNEHEKLKEILKRSNNKQEFDVKFSVNGVELNFQNFIDVLIKNYNRELNSRANDILERKFDKAIETLNETLEIMKDKLSG